MQRHYLDMQDIIDKHTSQLGPDSIGHQFDLALQSIQKMAFMSGHITCTTGTCAATALQSETGT